MSNRGQTISLYFGETSSHMGAHFWNIQHNLLNCKEQHDFLDVEQIFIEKKESKHSPLTIFFNLK